jgi:hypothetical protein
MVACRAGSWPSATRRTDEDAACQGDSKPGFGNECARSELGDGKPIEEPTRSQILDANRRLEKQRG